MQSVMRRTTARLAASAPNYFEVVFLVLVALLARFLDDPLLWRAGAGFCIWFALAALAFLYTCMGRGQLLRYLGWIHPRKPVCWLYAVGAGVAGAGMSLLIVHLAGHGFGHAPANLMFYGATIGPVIEEAIYRGAAFSVLYVTACGMKLSARGRIVLPVVLTALLFTASHLGVGLLTHLVIFGMGLGYAILRWRSNSSAVSAVMHATYNLAVSIAILYA